MKKFLIGAAFAALSAYPAFAADDKATTPPAKPSCGATVEACQKAVDGLTAQLAAETAAYQAARQQRINAQTAADDAALGAYVTANTAKPKAP